MGWETWERGEEGEAGEEVEQLLPRHHALAAGRRRHASSPLSLSLSPRLLRSYQPLCGSCCSSWEVRANPDVLWAWAVQGSSSSALSFSIWRKMKQVS
jgi:hypothetical protein